MKLMDIYSLLYNNYGPQGWWPLHGKYSSKTSLTEEEKFEICLGAVLTQNTSWKNVEKALENLRKNKLLNKDKLRKIKAERLAELIKSSGYNNQKAKKIKKFIKFLDSRQEITRENLLKVWGVGGETADSILLYAYSRPHFVIDSYTKRVMSRVGICDENIKYVSLQEVFNKNLKQDVDLFKEYHALIVEHAKRFCKKKPECENCPVKNECSYSQQRLN